MKNRKKRKDREQTKLNLSRRGFAASLLAGAGLAATRVIGPRKMAAAVSMKEADYYIPLDHPERTKK